MHRIGRTGRVGRTGRAITFVTPAQRDEIERIEREAKTSIGEWEPPEERLEHAPRPRRRDHAKEQRPREREKVPAKEPEGDDGAPETPRPEVAEVNGDHAKLFINRGERSGIDEDDIRWALVEGAVVPDEAIGEIRVLERFSFVDLEADHAEQALERLDGTKLKGKQVRVEYAKG